MGRAYPPISEVESRQPRHKAQAIEIDKALHALQLLLLVELLAVLLALQLLLSVRGTCGSDPMVSGPWRTHRECGGCPGSRSSLVYVYTVVVVEGVHGVGRFWKTRKKDEQRRSSLSVVRLRNPRTPLGTLGWQSGGRAWKRQGCQDPHTSLRDSLTRYCVRALREKELQTQEGHTDPRPACPNHASLLPAAFHLGRLC